jgi:drug/metabolite transporter (DMT)-like permease
MTLSTPSAGVRYMLAAAFFFSLMSLMVKVAGQFVPSQEIVLARGVVSLVLSYWMVKRARISPWGNRKWILILRGVFGFAAMSCFYYALTQLPIAEATVLHFTNPLWTALVAAVFLRERLSPWVLLHCWARCSARSRMSRCARRARRKTLWSSCSTSR